MNKPIADKGDVCPFHKKDVSKVCHTCPLYIRLSGTNKNNGQPVDNWGCSFAWMPILLIEATSETKMTSAAVNSFKNEMVGQNNLLKLLDGNQ